MISFLHPWALTGILAVGIPIAIHLIRERRKIAVVPSLLLFTNMKRITSRRKLENLFLLILRCLVILLICFLRVPISGNRRTPPARERRRRESRWAFCWMTRLFRRHQFKDGGRSI